MLEGHARCLVEKTNAGKRSPTRRAPAYSSAVQKGVGIVISKFVCLFNLSYSWTCFVRESFAGEKNM